MKTAMQDAIDTLNQNPNTYISKEDTIRLLTVVGLEKERQQIIDAHRQGAMDENHYHDHQLSLMPSQSEDYYNDIINQNHAQSKL